MKNSCAGVLLILFFASDYGALAQLESIPRIETSVTHPLPEGVILLTTRDFHTQFGAPNVFSSSLQIIDPLHPWPPIFFTHIAPQYRNKDGHVFQHIYFQDAINAFSFFDGSEGKYFISDTNFNLIDSIARPGREMDSHDLQINREGERMYMTTVDTLLKLFPHELGNPADSAILITIQIIEISNREGKIVFTWNPLEHIPLMDSYLSYYAAGKRRPYRGWDWSHANSARFTHDGNIVYSFRNIGVGKINRQTGRLMWKLGGKTPTIPVPDGGEYFQQHDFKELSPGIFSLFSNGDDDHFCQAAVYSIDESGLTARVARTYAPTPPIRSLSMGNFDTYDNGLYLVNYGKYASLEDKQLMFELIDTTGARHAAYYSSALNFAYEVHYVTAWKPQRPVIISEDGVLKMTGKEGRASWYRLAGDEIVHVSNGISLKPQDSGKYVAVIRQGFGWMVSKPYEYSTE